jgi:hypothetical protein
MTRDLGEHSVVTKIGHDDCVAVFPVVDHYILKFFYVILKSLKFWTQNINWNHFFTPTMETIIEQSLVTTECLQRSLTTMNIESLSR